jgi:hypothetical protein
VSARPPLDFPDTPLRIRQEGGRAHVFDPIRRRFVRLTPEEWVRQHLVHFLVEHRGYPPGLLAIEKGFVYNGMTRRADVVAYGAEARPVLLAECKKPDVELDAYVFEQVARYNAVVGAGVLLVTNGLAHWCYAVDPQAGTADFLADVPGYGEL